MTEQNRKPYLNLKLSMTEFFRKPVRWLYKSATRESQFEKPYVDLDYRQMHLEFPELPWPPVTPIDPVNNEDCSDLVYYWGHPEECGRDKREWNWDEDGGDDPDWPRTTPRKHTYIFHEPTCWHSVFSIERGGETTGSAKLVGLPPTSWDAYVMWNVSCAGPGTVEPTSGITTASGTFRYTVTAEDIEAGVLTIRVFANLLGHMTLQSSILMNVPNWPPGAPQGISKEMIGINPFAQLPPGVPKNFIGQEEIGKNGWQSNCEEKVLEFGTECYCAGLTWHADSADTVLRSNTCQIVVADATGACGPYSWAVTDGTGFDVANATTVGTSNSLVADGTACGTATIEVTGCDGITKATGYVRCSDHGSLSQDPAGYYWDALTDPVLQNACGSGSHGCGCYQNQVMCEWWSADNRYYYRYWGTYGPGGYSCGPSSVPCADHACDEYLPGDTVGNCPLPQCVAGYYNNEIRPCLQFGIRYAWVC